MAENIAGDQTDHALLGRSETIVTVSSRALISNHSGELTPTNASSQRAQMPSKCSHVTSTIIKAINEIASHLLTDMVKMLRDGE